MTGKPGAGPAKPAPAKTASAKPQASGPKAPSTAKAAAAGPKRPAAAAKAASPKDDDPFAIDTSAAAKAIPLSPKPLKGRTHPVKCPMCETTGYTSPRAAGQDVRCANPSCLVPIFTAPAIQKEVSAVEEPKRSRAAMAILGVAGVAGVAIVGGVLWLFVLGGNQPARTSSPDPGLAVNTTASPQSQVDPAAEEAARKAAAAKKKASQAPTLKDLQRSALDAMIHASRQGGATSSRKPFEVRLTAESYAWSGDLDGAREQMKRFNVVQPSIPFYRVLPLVAIAWKELQKGDREAARATLDEAQKYAQRIPDRGRDPWDTVAALATILAATGRGEEGAALVREYDRAEDRIPSRYWAAVHVVRERGTFDLDEYLAAHPWQDWEHPHAVAVTLGLGARGYWNEALTWGSSQPGTVERTDCLVAWADALAAHAAETNDAGKLEPFDAAAESLRPPGRARMYARAAARLAEKGKTSESQPLLRKAVAALEGVSPARPVTLTGMKQIYNIDLPDPTAARTTAYAAAEIARAEALLGQAEASWKSLQRALDFARGTAPSVPAVQNFLQEVEFSGVAGIQNQLQQALSLPSADRARIAANRYQKNLDALHQAARKRMQLEAALLSEAANWNLGEPLWKEISSRSQAADPNEKENWFDTAVPWILAERLRAAGLSEQAQPVEAAIQGVRSTAGSEELLRQRTAALATSGNVKQAAALIERSDWSETERNRWALRLACRLVRDGKPEAAVQLVAAFGRDPLFREDAYDMVAAQATRAGHGSKVWELAQTAGFRPTEKIAYLRGFVVGVERAPNSGPAGGGGTQPARP